MGFPDFYGKNWDAWIDCMSHIDTPEDQLLKITVTKNETLEIQILVEDGTNYFKSSTWALFTSCVAAVNGEFDRNDSETRIIITEKIIDF